MAACILAWISTVATREMTIVDYRNRFQPPAQLWRALLVSNQYRSVDRTEDREKLMRSPELFSGGQSEVRIGPGLELLWFPRGTLGDSSELWHRDSPSEGVKAWIHFPFTLRGLEELETLLRLNPARSRIKTRSQAKPIDPKEIRY